MNTRGDCHVTDHDDAYDVSEMQQPVFSPDPQSIESNSFAPSDDSKQYVHVNYIVHV